MIAAISRLATRGASHRNNSDNEFKGNDIVLIILNINNLNDINIMSAKTVIQALEDSELIKIFLDFVQLHRLQYEKVHKEISYKCFEATWMLNIVKATGYGRTET